MTETNFEFKVFTNEELLLIFYRFNKYVSDIEKNLERNIVVKKVDAPMGIANAVSMISDKEKEEFLNSDYFLKIKALVSKLKPITELIEECSEDLRQFATNIK
jgi:hypothetical protein